MNVIELATRLINIPSVNPGSAGCRDATTGEAGMADAVEAVMRKLGADITRTEPLPGRPNVIGFFDFSAAETVVFDAHLDTVPAAGMTIPPFTAEQRDSRLWGRGACDVKGPLAAMLCALAQVRASGARAKYNILMAAVCDEEAGFSGARHFAKSLETLHAASPAPIIGAIVAEPTLLHPVIAHKGSVRWKITTRGRAAHSSTPRLGSNAIYLIAPIISALEKHAADLEDSDAHPRLGTPTLSVGMISGGSAPNIVPDLCEIRVDRRLIPGETIESATAALEKVMEGSGAEISKPTVASHPMETPPDHPLISMALQAARAAGCEPAPQYASYCTNASFYAQNGIPAIVFGPGSIEQAHTRDEWISLDQLEKGVAAYRALLTG